MTPYCVVCGDDQRANCEFCIPQLREEVKQMVHEEQPPTMEELRQAYPELFDEAFIELVEKGLIEWTGEYCNGHRLWHITDKGRYALSLADVSP